MADEAYHDYYVYVLYRESGEPFYVGMARGRRWETFPVQSDTQRNQVAREIMDRGGQLVTRKVAEGLTKREGYVIEKAVIMAIGRMPSGPLVNQTDGGDGAGAITPEIREKIVMSAKHRPVRRGFKLSDEWKAKLSAAAIRRRRKDAPEKDGRSDG